MECAPIFARVKSVFIITNSLFYSPKAEIPLYTQLRSKLFSNIVQFPEGKKLSKSYLVYCKFNIWSQEYNLLRGNSLRGSSVIFWEKHNFWRFPGNFLLNLRALKMGYTKDLWKSTTTKRFLFFSWIEIYMSEYFQVNGKYNSTAYTVKVRLKLWQVLRSETFILNIYILREEWSEKNQTNHLYNEIYINNTYFNLVLSIIIIWLHQRETEEISLILVTD